MLHAASDCGQTREGGDSPRCIASGADLAGGYVRAGRNTFERANEPFFEEDNLGVDLAPFTTPSFAAYSHAGYHPTHKSHTLPTHLGVDFI
jgi:hypothetical protein